MSVVVLGSVRGAPGVTTAAFLLAGCLTKGLVAEADLDGGTAAVRYGLGSEPGMATLAASRTTDPRGWREHAQQAGDLPVLVGPDSPALATTLWSRAGSYLAQALAVADADVVVDAGRLRGETVPRPLLGVASLTAIVVRPDAEHLVTLARRLADLRDETTMVGVILAGTGTYAAGDVADQLGVDVLGKLPGDTRRRSPTHARDELSRSARSLADAVVARLESIESLDGKPEALAEPATDVEAPA